MRKMQRKGKLCNKRAAVAAKSPSTEQETFFMKQTVGTNSCHPAAFVWCGAFCAMKIQWIAWVQVQGINEFITCLVMLMVLLIF